MYSFKYFIKENYKKSFMVSNKNKTRGYVIAYLMGNM